MAERIEVHEVGPARRAAEYQDRGADRAEARWIKAEAEAGVKEIEVCSFVPPKLLPQFADARRWCAGR
jgi:hydroxymethylglutaryl-CoA lyase